MREHFEIINAAREFANALSTFDSMIAVRTRVGKRSDDFYVLGVTIDKNHECKFRNMSALICIILDTAIAGNGNLSGVGNCMCRTGCLTQDLESVCNIIRDCNITLSERQRNLVRRITFL